MAVLVKTRSALGVMSLIAAATSACGGGSNAPHVTTGVAASCAAPQLSVAPTTARVGNTMHASGKWFAADCYDTGQPGNPPPLTGLRLQVSQTGRVWTVATGVDASGDDFTINVSFRLPRELRAGAAQLAVVDHGAPVRIQVLP